MGMDSNLQEELERPYYKLSDINGSYLRMFYRYLGGNLAIVLKKTKIKPNTITILSLVLVIASLPFFYTGLFPYNIVAAVLLFFSMILDKADGSLARIRGEGSPLGTWLDSTTDNVGIFMIFVAIGLHFQFRLNHPEYWILVLFSFATYTSSKLLYIFFKKYFGDGADEIVEQEKKKHKIRSSFHVNEVFVNNTVLIFTLFGAFKALVIFLSLYGSIFFLGSYVIFTKFAITKNRKYDRKEELISKF